MVFRSKAYHDDQDLVSLTTISRPMSIRSDDSEPTLSGLVDLYTKVQTIQNRHKRMINAAVQRGKQPDHTAFQAELQGLLKQCRAMLLSTGISEDKVPKLPNANPLDFSEDYWRRALNASLQSSSTSSTLYEPSTSRRISDISYSLSPNPTRPSSSIESASSTVFPSPLPPSNTPGASVPATPLSPLSPQTSHRPSSYRGSISELPPPSLNLYKARLCVLNIFDNLFVKSC